MKKHILFSRYLVLSILFTGFISTSLYAKPLNADEKSKRKKEVVAMLSGTTWDVEMFPMDDPKKKTIKDVVSYEHGRLKSKVFALEGYSESNLTVTIEDDGKAIWETMQSHADKGPIFWRGELSDKTVNGVLSRQNKDGSTEAYSLRGVQSGTFEVAPEKPPVIIEAPKEVIPPAAPAVPEATSALDALLGKKTTPAVVNTAVTVPAAAKTAMPAAASASAVKPAVAAPVKSAAAAVPAKAADVYVKPAVAAMKTEVKASVPAAPAKAAESVMAEESKEKKSKWSW